MITQVARKKCETIFDPRVRRNGRGGSLVLTVMRGSGRRVAFEKSAFTEVKTG